MIDNVAFPRVPHVLIGVTFIWAAGWIAYLWAHRKGDWPKAWALALVFNCLFSCGLSRILHGFDAARSWRAFTDWYAAASGLVALPLLPWAILAILKFPTPKQVEHAIRGNMAKHSALAEAEKEKRRKEKAERTSKLLLSLFKQTGAPPEVQVQLDAIISEITNDSDPSDTGPLSGFHRGKRD
jgi:hypothetical protein